MSRDDQANDPAGPPPAFDPEDTSPSDASQDPFHRAWWFAQLIGVGAALGISAAAALASILKRLQDRRAGSRKS